MTADQARAQVGDSLGFRVALQVDPCAAILDRDVKRRNGDSAGVILMEGIKNRKSRLAVAGENGLEPLVDVRQDRGGGSEIRGNR